jgi:hypothetical protein
MYEKFATFLRLEICVNRLKDLGLNKGLENLNALRQRLIVVTNRLADLEGASSTFTSISLYSSGWPCRSAAATARSLASRFRTPG